MSSRSIINQALRQLMNEESNIILIGQSIRDPFGGAYKITRGLTKQFDDRIIDTPISEAAMIGLSIGLSMQGYIPIVEIMFEDFLTLCVDQIHNIAEKVNNHQKIKIIIRTQHNHDKNYGPSHSQNMDWLINSIPCTECYTYAKNHTANDIVNLYQNLIYTAKKPVIIIKEQRILY